MPATKQGYLQNILLTIILIGMFLTWMYPNDRSKVEQDTVENLSNVARELKHITDNVSSLVTEQRNFNQAISERYSQRELAREASYMEMLVKYGVVNDGESSSKDKPPVKLSDEDLQIIQKLNDKGDVDSLSVCGDDGVCE